MLPQHAECICFSVFNSYRILKIRVVTCPFVYMHCSNHFCRIILLLNVKQINRFAAVAVVYGYFHIIRLSFRKVRIACNFFQRSTVYGFIAYIKLINGVRHGNIIFHYAMMEFRRKLIFTGTQRFKRVSGRAVKKIRGDFYVRNLHKVIISPYTPFIGRKRNINAVCFFSAFIQFIQLRLCNIPFLRSILVYGKMQP